jgi:hydrogenase maturation protease
MKQANDLSERVLVIAYGNTLCSDDGAAWRVAEEIRRSLPAIAIFCVHQLTPELAEDASRAGTVIFLDAARSGEPGEVRCQPVSADRLAKTFSHTLGPEQMLTICKQLYGAEPHGFLVSIAGECFDHGEALSPRVTAALPQVVAMVKELAAHSTRFLAHP